MNLAFGQGGMRGGQGGQVVINAPGNAGQRPGGNPGGNGQVVGGGQAPAANQGAAPVGGRGGNRLKERFLASAAFKETYQRAYAEMHQAIFGSGVALTELDRLAAVISTSNLLDASTIQSEVASLRTAINSQAAKTTP